MTDYNDGKWHGWNGGECPVHPESEVKYVQQNEFDQHEFGGWIDKAGELNWSADAPDQIISFRVTKVYRQPREWWVHPTANDVSATPVAAYVRVREVLDE